MARRTAFQSPARSAARVFQLSSSSLRSSLRRTLLKVGVGIRRGLKAACLPATAQAQLRSSPVSWAPSRLQSARQQRRGRWPPCGSAPAAPAPCARDHAPCSDLPGIWRARQTPAPPGRRTRCDDGHGIAHGLAVLCGHSGATPDIVFADQLAGIHLACGRGAAVIGISLRHPQLSHLLAHWALRGPGWHRPAARSK